MKNIYFILLNSAFLLRNVFKYFTILFWLLEKSKVLELLSTWTAGVQHLDPLRRLDKHSVSAFNNRLPSITLDGSKGVRSFGSKALK